MEKPKIQNGSKLILIFTRDWEGSNSFIFEI